MQPGSQSRTPRGVRGLKSLGEAFILLLSMSHPSRGAWVEIHLCQVKQQFPARRTPRGVRGLKYAVVPPVVSSVLSRTPRGVRGLK